MSTLTDGIKQSEAVATKIEQSIGKKPQVGFMWHNGNLSRVTVTFNELPKDKTIDQIAESARTSIKAEFKQEPREIMLGFAIKPTK
jgi:hypothetical protein